MGDNNRSYSVKYFIIVILLFYYGVGFSQNKYSELALTGRGDLELIGDKFRLQKEVYHAFKKMKGAALKEGVSIQIVSAYRSFNHQRNIWNRKYDKYIANGESPENSIKKIIQYTTLPGTSRHHWGTDIDIIEGSVKYRKNMLNEENYANDGVYSELKKWMDLNAEKFGFYLVYNNNLNRKGFKYEPWHYSFKVVSKKMLEDYSLINLDDFYETKNLRGVQYLTSEFLKKYEEENILDVDLKLK